MASKCYENYPAWIVLVSNLLGISIYAIGAYLMFRFGIIWFFVYLVYIIGLELRVMMVSCTNCYYYGKVCAFGRGKLCSSFLKKGMFAKYHNRKITWKDLVPDFMVSLIPMFVGAILLIKNFEWLILILIIILALLAFFGTGFDRSQLACKYCRQRELGCPAEQMFRKKAGK